MLLLTLRQLFVLAWDSLTPALIHKSDKSEGIERRISELLLELNADTFFEFAKSIATLGAMLSGCINSDFVTVWPERDRAVARNSTDE